MYKILLALLFSSNFAFANCFLIYDLKAGKMFKEEGSTCSERLIACGTFEVPLAVMGFDSGAIKGLDEVWKWDGYDRKRPDLNKDHSARTWLKYSVVWYSKRLTPKIGEKNVQKYLKDFHYGNEDLSGGLIDAWLNAPYTKKPMLTISPKEQMEFLKALWTGKLPVKAEAMKLTREIMFLETTPGGFALSGKAGSIPLDEARTLHTSWFIGHLQKNEKEYLFVTSMTDKKPSGEGGAGASIMTKRILTRLSLW